MKVDPAKLNAVTLNLQSLLGAYASDAIAAGGRSVVEVGEYTAEQAATLAPLVGTKAFPKALKAAGSNVAMFAGLKAVNAADAADAKLRADVSAFLSRAAAVLAAAALAG